MRKTLFVLLAASTVMMSGTAAQQRPAQMAGTWQVHIEHYKGRIVDEQWIMTQTGTNATGKVVVKSGMEFPIEGSIDGNKIKWKVTTRPASSPEGERFHHFIGTLNGDEIKGTLERDKHDDDGTFVAKHLK